VLVNCIIIIINGSRCCCVYAQSRQAVQDMLQQGKTLRHKDTAQSDDARDELESDESDDGEQMIHESTTRKTTLEDMEAGFSEDDDDIEPMIADSAMRDGETVKALADAPQDSSHRRRKAPRSFQINPSQYLVVEAERSSASSQTDNKARVALAFSADDDVVAEFAAEKKKVVERERPKDIDLRLPGWGEWAGPGIKPSQRRKKRLVIL